MYEYVHVCCMYIRMSVSVSVSVSVSMSVSVSVFVSMSLSVCTTWILGLLYVRSICVHGRSLQRAY